MSHPQPAQPAKLVIGIFLQDQSLFAEMAVRLKGLFGPVELVSPWFDFHYTDYYKAEMGWPLYRRMLVFQEHVEQDALAGIKLRTNGLEKEYRKGACRRVNLDPGLLLLERFVLATGKNYTHRIYLCSGIYADLTLVYQKNGYQVLPWTYPDYADERMRAFLANVRRKYSHELKAAAARRGDSQTEQEQRPPC